MNSDGLYRFPVTYEGLPQEQPFLADAIGDSLANDIVLPNTPTELKLTVTMQQFTDLLSAALNGANRHFGERYIDVIYPLIKAGKEYAMSCENVADCIETSEDVQNALIEQIDTNLDMQNALRRQIADTLTQLGFDPDSTTAASVEADEIKELENCDLDALWAGIRDGIVQRLDDNARQFLEIMVSKLDLVQRANSIIAAIPVVGALASATIDAFVELIPDLKNAYEAYSSIDAMDTAACEIFALVCSECRYPTNQELFDYFANLGASGIDDLTTLSTTVAYEVLASGASVASPVIAWHTLIAIQIFTLLINEKFANLAGIASVADMAGLGEDFANDNWLTLCDSCNENFKLWTHLFSSGMGDFDFVYSGTTQRGTLSGDVVQGVTASSTLKVIEMTMPLDPTWRVESARITFRRTGTGTAGNFIFRWRPTPDSNTGAVNPSIGSGGAILGWLSACQHDGFAAPGYLVGNKQLYIYIECAGTVSTEFNVEVQRVDIVFQRDYAKGGSPTSDDNLCA